MEAAVAHATQFMIKAKSKIRRALLPRYVMREKLAAAIRSMLEEVSPKKLSADLTAGLSKRMKDTLQLLLSGDSEKEAAAKLKLSPHTVHIHVKNLYKRLGVCSRAELMAKCLGNNGK